MVVQHNIPAMNANRYFGINNSGLSKSLEKLSSGYAINRAGDNAAGLAVSEKMRSQIAGLTQGVKNAEDGISMIQTFEGALTETDSILQRMKTLATQAANGTYQDDVDRDAIQLEFDQLNDELNQIADTDFNGVVVLNGGQMADGVKAVDGKFDYENRTAKELTSKDITRIDGQIFDDSSTTAKMNFKADDVWKDISNNNNWDRSDTTKDDGPDSVDLTFTFNASTQSWKLTGATSGVDTSSITVNKTENGGFSLDSKTVTGFANVVLDQTGLVTGDTLTLRLNNPAAGVAAPTNAGASVMSSTIVQGNATGSKPDNDVNLAVELNSDLADGKTTMTKDINSVLNALNGATFEVTYTDDLDGDASMKGGIESIVMVDADGNRSSLTLDTNENALTTSDGVKFTIASAQDASGATGTGALTVKMADGTEIMTLTPTDNVNGTEADAATGAAATGGDTGTKTFKLGIEFNSYDLTKVPTVELSSSKDNAVSDSNAFRNATAPLTYTDHIILQSGARSKDAVDFTFKYSSGGLGDLKANMNCSAREDGLGTQNLKLTDQDSANYAIDRIDNAINKVSMVRATFGAVQNRLEHKIDNMNVTKENITSAESRIRDTNMAEEMTNFTKNQILSQASQAMLAQANQLPQGVLQLLG